jgi:hypothetical protein
VELDVEEMTKKLLEAVLLPTENENFSTEKDVRFPEWSKSPHSDVSHLALTVGALLNRVDGVGVSRPR